MRSAAVLDSLKWEPDSPTSIYVVNLKTSALQQFTTESRFITHHINGFEIALDDNNEDGSITLVMDCVTYPDPAVVQRCDFDVLRNEQARKDFSKIESEITRYTLHLKNGTVANETFPIQKPEPNNFDFPIINEQFRYRQYCNVYGLHMKGVEHGTLMKKNMCDETKDIIWYKPNHFPSEPWFVPDPEGSAEDDGILLDVILDGDRGKSYLAVFDAKTLRMINRAYLPNFIPRQLTRKIVRLINLYKTILQVLRISSIRSDRKKILRTWTSFNHSINFYFNVQKKSIYKYIIIST